MCSFRIKYGNEKYIKNNNKYKKNRAKRMFFLPILYNYFLLFFEVDIGLDDI